LKNARGGGVFEKEESMGRQDKVQSPSLKDQLEYMADLLSELSEMARRNKLTTLEGILDLAYAEARLRAADGLKN
jgi:hypothetical protein